jgi:hypothetical protein
MYCLFARMQQLPTMSACQAQHTDAYEELLLMFVVVSALASAASSANQLYLRYTLKASATTTMH